MSPRIPSIVVPQFGQSDEEPSPIWTPHDSPQASPKHSSAVSPPVPQKRPKIPIEIKSVKVQKKQQHLAEIITRKFATSTFDSQKRPYLPEPCIKDCIVTMKTVEGELSRAPSHSQYEAEILRDVSSWVVAYASKVFAITVQCHIDPDDLLTSIITFYNADFEDDSLPISDPAAPDSESDRPPKTKAFQSETWSDQRHDEFFEFQWRCLAPVFVREHYEYDLWSQCIMPFTIVQGTVPRSGSFSSVYKVVVQPDHQQRHSSLEVSLFYPSHELL
jgi:hypothetical protein